MRLRPRATLALTATTALSAALTWPATAGPLRPGFVPANAAWVGHVNLEALLDSALGDLLMDGGFGVPDMRAEATEQMGFDPATEILGVTIYGLDSDPEPAAIVLEATSAIDAMLERLADEETRPDGYSVVEAEGHTLHAYSRDGGSPESYACIVERGRERIVVLAGSIADTNAATALVEGRGTSLDNTDERNLDLRGYKNAMIFLEAGPIHAIGGHAPYSEVLKAATGLSLRVVEEDDDTDLVSLTLATPSTDEARNLSDVLTGMVGMMRMISAQKDGMEPIADVLRSIAIRPDRSALTIDLRLHREIIDAVIRATAQDDETEAWTVDEKQETVDHP